MPDPIQTTDPLTGASTDATIAASAHEDYSLETLTETVHYNEWIYESMRPWIGTRVLELGAGIGNLTPYFLREERSVLAIDIDAGLVERHRSGIPAQPRLTVECVSVQDVAAGKSAPGTFDSIVSSNVLEHIPDGIDHEVVQAIHTLLRVGGTTIHWVPAMNSIYGTIDTSFGHHRRYNRSMATALFAPHGFRVIRCEYWNMPGFFAWWFRGRILRRPALGKASTLAFDRYVVPLLRRVEPHIPRPFGQSLLLVAQKV
jgi:2-polyprenyl-3-methyl-5-hydroxy-6-metoxy-1,4-benzoquinol methylase